MTDDNDAATPKGKTLPKRDADKRALWGESRARGFFAASDYVRKTVRKAGSSRGFAETRLLTRWEEIAGVDAAAICQPVKVSYAKGGIGATLIVWCEGAHAPEVEMSAPQLIERVNAAYGYNAVSRIHITQSEQPPERSAPPGAPRRRKLTAEEERQVEDLIADVGDPSLKEALRRLGRNVKSRVADPEERPAAPASTEVSNADPSSEGRKTPPTRPHS